MFRFYAEKNGLTVRQRETVTSGSVNVYQVHFAFSQEWEGMTRTACFQSGEKIVSVLLDSSGVCAIPWEVTAPDRAGRHLLAGVCGTRDGAVILPTVWADCGIILQGVCTGSEPRPATPGLYEQMLDSLSGKADGIGLEDGQLCLLSGDKTLASVTLPACDGSAAGETATDAEMEELLDEVFGSSQDNH